MKINAKLLNIPPYISTSWNNVDSVFLKKENGKDTLVIVLKGAATIVTIPDLDKHTLESVFTAHAQYLEEASKTASSAKGSISFGLPISSEMFGNNLETMTSAMQHNPNQADAPDLPPELLNKIASIANILGDEATSTIPKPEPHCNCVHCQIARALQGSKPMSHLEEENDGEAVTEEDLKFRNWDIKQIAEKLYEVTNPLDSHEHYQVFLGEPLGCTCGQKNCEHIRTVLNT